MKKLALVLGSLLVVGTAASAKEVMPAPVVVPERVVEIVEKPVIVYRDREVAPKWRPTGSVSIEAKVTDAIEGHNGNETNWKGQDLKAKVTTKAGITFTEKQKLDVKFEDEFGLEKETSKGDAHKKTELKHTYMFGKLGTSMVNLDLETTFTHTKVGGKGYEKKENNVNKYDVDGKSLKFKPVFDFSEYFFKNDYVKATALQLAPVFTHTWAFGDYTFNEYSLYANAEFTLPLDVKFQAEFDNLYTHTKLNKASWNKGYDRNANTGSVELTLSKNFVLYNQGSHKFDLGLKGVYATGWSYSRKDDLSVLISGTEREGKNKNERWGGYTAKFEPTLNYNFKATEYVTLTANLGGEYKNRTDRRPDAKHWRWQPYAKVGFKAAF